MNTPRISLTSDRRWIGALVVAASLGVGAGSSASAGVQGSVDGAGIVAGLTELLARYEAWGFSGAVLVSRGGRVVFEQGYGYANRATGERNTPATRFDFASVAKTFTGAAVLLLEADGALSVDDRLARHIGPLPERKSTATVRHLATHKAGLAHRSESVDLAYGGTRTAWIESMKSAPFESAPGESYRYTNAGFSLLAAVVEEIAEVPYQDFVRRRLFAPAGLDDTAFYADLERGEPGFALGYLDDSEVAAPDEYGGDWGWGTIGSTGIVSTVRDIHDWFAAQRGGAVLPEPQMRRVFDPDETEAFGWHVDTDDRGRRRIHKGGGLRAMQTQVIAYPDHEIVVVWAHNNMTDNWRQPLNRGIVAVALGDEVTLPPMPGERAPERPPAGWYATADGTLAEIEWSGDGLAIGGNGLGVDAGRLRPGVDGGWVAFEPAQLSGIEMAIDPDGVIARLVPGDEVLALTPVPDGGRGLAPLPAPSEPALAAAREVAAAFQAGDHLAVWRAQAYRPVRGPYAADAWQERVGFIAAQLGGDATVVAEAWVRRDGDWRYWRTLRGPSGVEVVLRFAMSESGLVRAFGMNPASAVPEFEEIRPIE